MLLRDVITETTTAIAANKARTGLTVLGIVIGIASVITMVSVGRGAQEDIEERIQGIGSNLLMVQPNRQRGFSAAASSSDANSLTNADLPVIASFTDIVAHVAPEATTRTQIIAGGNNTNTSVLGTTSGYVPTRNLTITDGAFFTDAHTDRMAKVAVLGADTAVELFGSGVSPVGQSVRINGMRFSVLGVAGDEGGGDETVYMPLSTAQQFLIGNDVLGSINIAVVSSDKMAEAEEVLTAALLAAHGITDATAADFRMRSQADIIETASSVTGTFTILLGAIAGISLLVGGIGIMNMMLTTVTERTREIGLRKALGAKRCNISTQFLMEAVVLTVMGGLLGVALGLGAAYVIRVYFETSTLVTMESIILAFGVSTAIGVIFGYYPALRAARLNPIEALRYE